MTVIVQPNRNNLGELQPMVYDDQTGQVIVDTNGLIVSSSVSVPASSKYSLVEPIYTTTLGIQEANNYAQNLIGSSSISTIKIKLKPNVYTLINAESILISENVDLDFNGATININAPISFAIQTNSVGVTYGKIENGVFNINSPSTITNFITGNTSNHMVIIDNLIINVNTTITNVISVNGTSNCIVQNCYIQENASGLVTYAYYMGNGTGQMMFNNSYTGYTQNDGSTMYYLGDGDTTVIRGGRMEGGSTLLKLDSTNGSIYQSRFETLQSDAGGNIAFNMSTSGNIIDQTVFQDISITGTTNSLFSIISNVGTIGDIAIIDSVFTSANAVINGANSGNFMISNCSFKNCNGNSTLHEFYGLFTVTVTNCTFTALSTGSDLFYAIKGIFSNNIFLNAFPALDNTSDVISKNNINDSYAFASPTISTNPPVSATVYQNTNSHDIKISVPITYPTATTSAVTAYLRVGTSSTVGTNPIIDNVSEPTGLLSANGYIRNLKATVPGGQYFEVDVSNATIGTAVVDAS